jgi:5'-3' exonuclease
MKTVTIIDVASKPKVAKVVPVKFAAKEQSNPILIDAQSLIKRNILCSALDDLKAGETFTGGVYASITTLVSILSKPEIRPAGIYAFFDSGIPLERMAACPYYKGGDRAEKKKALTDEQIEKALSQLHTCRELFELLGIICAAYQDREADDCVAAACQLLPDQSPIVVSGDKDLFQTIMFREGISVWDLANKQMVTRDNFTEVTGVYRGAYPLYKTLCGDQSDNLKGAIGVGPDKAAELMGMLPVWGLEDSLPEVQLDAVCDYLTGLHERKVWQQALLDDRNRIGLELQAVDLRCSFGSTEGLAAKLRQRPEPDWKEFLRRCKELRFSSVISDQFRFLTPFKKSIENRR